jgi:hypothetical protein
VTKTKDDRAPPKGGGDQVHDEAERVRRTGDDTPRETPSAKGSDTRLKAQGGALASEERVKTASGDLDDADVGKRNDQDDVRFDLPAPPRNIDTRPDTQASRASGAEIVASSDHSEDWTPPEKRDQWRSPDGEPGREPLPKGARLDIGFGRGQVRTFQVRGVFGLVIAILVTAAVLALMVAFFTFALGVGTAIAVSSAVAALAGFGLTRVRRALGPGRAIARRPADPAKRPDPGDDDRNDDDRNE